jgi:hypothetical protein
MNEKRTIRKGIAKTPTFELCTAGSEKFCARNQAGKWEFLLRSKLEIGKFPFLARPSNAKGERRVGPWKGTHAAMFRKSRERG